ncbi:MAG: hypothetical protein L6Q99_16195 [Planctomycetes bacterium]|nr:hypothetical protein [Planctomycetota bacterium]
MFVSIRDRRVREARDPARRAGSFLALLSLSACAAPKYHEPHFDAVLHELDARASTPDELERALELAELAPLSLAWPDDALRRDPRREEYWHASALAWNQGVREARRRFLAARALIDSEGAPEPLALEGDSIAGDGERESELRATFDVLGVFGLGVARAARALATEEARLAYAEYETRVWNAWIDVDRARVELVTRRRLLAALDELATENEPLVRRREILATSRFVPAAELDGARAQDAMLATERANLHARVAAAREALALAAGVPIESDSLDAAADEWLLRLLAESPPNARAQAVAAPLGDGEADPITTVTEPSAAELWDSRPEVRAMRVRCTLAEAKLDSVLAERIPEFRLGVKSMFTPESVLAGPMLDAALAWPGARDGRIAAARQECEEMREAVEAELLAAVARARTAAAEWRAAHAVHGRELAGLDADSRSSWLAAQARFLNDVEALAEASGMLGERVRALKMVHEHDAELALAALEFRRASGARPVTRPAPSPDGANAPAANPAEVQP